MPFYSYFCEECKKEFEVVKSIHDPDPEKCTRCNKNSFYRIFKNVGLTDRTYDRFKRNQEERDKEIRKACYEIQNGGGQEYGYNLDGRRDGDGVDWGYLDNALQQIDSSGGGTPVNDTD